MYPPAQSPLVAYLIASTSTVVSLLATQGLITNGWERTISGIAAVVIPLVYLAANAVHAHASATVKAAALAGPTPSGVPSGGT